MLRTLWVLLVAVAVTIPASLATMAFAGFKHGQKTVDRIIRLWARSLVWAAGIDLRAENLELLDPKQRYILIANHYSYFDIPCIFAAIPQPIRFMAKVSLFKIPIFGWALGRTGFIPIDRKNRRTAVKSFDLAGERIRRGNTIVVFPEEGRSRERAMRPFQRGGFLLALKSELPIVPTAIKGTFDVMPANSRRVRPGPVTVTLTPPIATEGLSIRDREKLSDEARSRIEKLVFGEEPVLGPRSSGGRAVPRT
ncbi:MAG TPA: lysophospholipid acyltransferase family protein [Thermoanaerobaculia bacterium]|jgi:1-acyl-sn-glycerol-3-phosphate acyltransferase|nr:lysophospholipid acyltransferase family protein [Thermoanaerobaculia bacterium]